MKKIISLLLVLVMTFSMVMPSFAAERINSENYYKPDYDGYPVIIVRGINFGGLIYGSNGELAMQFKAEDIFKMLGDMVKGALIDKNEDFFIDSVIDFVWGLMGDLASDKDGSSLNKDVTAEYYTKALSEYDIEDEFGYETEHGMAHTAAEIAGDEHAYFFNYDWRLSPEELAAQLNELVETAKKDSGKDKVKIVCASMGGMVATAYLYYYGTQSVDSCVYLCAAHNGTYVAGSALNGNIEIVPEAMNNIFSSLASGNGPFVDFLMKALNKSGIYKLLAFLLNKFIENNIDKVYDEVLRDALKENGIGRPSTRAAIIETLFKRHYIRKERKNLWATPTGVELIGVSREELLKSAELTGRWEKKLRQIERHEYDPHTFLNELKQMVSQLVVEVLSDNTPRHVSITVEPPKKGKKR